MTEDIIILNCQMLKTFCMYLKSLVIYALHQTYLSYQIKEIEMSGTYIMCEWDWKSALNFSWNW
jgi:hypothetical protein